jgi:hypothetical protein
MEAVQIQLSDEFGTVLAGRSVARRLRVRVEDLARDHGRVVVDFDGVATASPSFADEFFAKLPEALFNEGRVRFENVPESLDALIRFVVRHRQAAAGD